MRTQPHLDPSTTPRSIEGWTACLGCCELLPQEELAAAYGVCPLCGHHHRLTATERVELLFGEEFARLPPLEETPDPLQFVDLIPYQERLQKARDGTGLHDALVTGIGSLEGLSIATAIMEFSFLGGSMGSSVGEQLTRLLETARERRLPVLLVTSSGGARMQEGVFSLLQMAKTAGAMASLRTDGIPTVSLLCDPTSGGVTASFATLSDLLVGEPGALICFTGPRVIEQTLRQQLPPGAQRAEFLLAHGMLDLLLPRQEQKNTLATLFRYLQPPQQRG